MERTGKCLCGAVTYTATLEPTANVCHCSMCRRWSGGVFLSTTGQNVKWTGEDKIKVFASSDWAERGFCGECGASLFYRLTTPGAPAGAVSLAFGTLDDQSGFELGQEWFIDKRPDAYAFAGERKCFTEAEVFAMFGGT